MKVKNERLVHDYCPIQNTICIVVFRNKMLLLPFARQLIPNSTVPA
jgi:hypothetical protein